MTEDRLLWRFITFYFCFYYYNITDQYFRNLKIIFSSSPVDMRECCSEKRLVLLNTRQVLQPLNPCVHILLTALRVPSLSSCDEGVHVWWPVLLSVPLLSPVWAERTVAWRASCTPRAALHVRLTLSSQIFQINFKKMAFGWFACHVLKMPVKYEKWPLALSIMSDHCSSPASRRHAIMHPKNWRLPVGTRLQRQVLFFCRYSGIYPFNCLMKLG